jgi:hypothetical protein
VLSKIMKRTAPAVIATAVPVKTILEWRDNFVRLPACLAREAIQFFDSSSTTKPTPPTIIKVMTVRLTTGSPANRVNESCQRLNPALQKAETL